MALLLLGAAVGGAAAAVETWRDRQVRRRVAARLILGDMYVVEAALDLVSKKTRWVDRPQSLTAASETWRAQREAFAAGTNAAEWAIVDGWFNNLARTLPMVRPGQPATTDDVDVVKDVLAGVERARAIVLERSASSRELRNLEAELRKRGLGHSHASGSAAE